MLINRLNINSVLEEKSENKVTQFIMITVLILVIFNVI
jgi:hypothetical protein